VDTLAAPGPPGRGTGLLGDLPAGPPGCRRSRYGVTYGGVHKPLLTLSCLAAVTTRLRLGTSVLVPMLPLPLPLRDPFTVVKQAATPDRLSGGRFTLGVGGGWDPVEFGNVGADFTDRGRRRAGRGPARGVVRR
jgi:alkanesulfonate monooxygenase SsuD/methylene tetrahydromethanopterin reductase-like flavin-dependent oxidoreductase (luciferase family)